MKKMALLLGVFFICLAAPISFLVLRTFQSLEHEERAEFRYFTESLFDRIEADLARIVIREESRPVDDYRVSRPDDGNAPGTQQSPLAAPPQEAFVLGYFQNNPDGSMLSPLADETPQQGKTSNLQAQLQGLNALFNSKKSGLMEMPSASKDDSADITQPEQELETSLAAKYFKPTEPARQKRALGQEEKLLQEVPFEQVQRLAQADKPPVVAKQSEPGAAYRAPAALVEKEVTDEADRRWALEIISSEQSSEAGAALNVPTGNAGTSSVGRPTMQVEVTPLQSVFLDKEHIFIFRRIGINNQIYRQGFAIRIHSFLEDLLASHFSNQPMTGFANLQLTVTPPDNVALSVQDGIAAAAPEFVMQRKFPRPFAFLTATLRSDNIPRSSGRGTLMLLVLIIGGVTLLGFAAIYKSMHVIVELAERRAGFVSAVTHELKTPLTNIKMYSEMLAQGIARDRQREQEYFQVMNSESSRLARLIDNVLEFAKLERRQRPLHMVSGTFTEVLAETRKIMQEKIKQEGFDLVIENKADRPFTYDREVMVQVLINLLDNSIKFGKEAPDKHILLKVAPAGGCMEISIADAGPGIDPTALNKVFDDFYREDNSLTRKTKGTGIGLALVKKFVLAMGGRVKAANNSGPGCTITVSLPLGSNLYP